MFLSEFLRRVASTGGSIWQIVPPGVLPFLIFAFRTSDLSLATIRMLSVVRGSRWLAWLTGFAQALLFVIAVAGVLSNLGNPWNLVAYAAGFATGNVVGILLEGRFGLGHSLLQILSPARAGAIAEELRREGFGVTELEANGTAGTVGLLLCNARNRELDRVRQRILAADPQAFVTAENVRALHGGWRA